MNPNVPSYRDLDTLRDRVLALCGDLADARVLDAGCGDGMIGRALLDRVGLNGSVAFLDIDPDPVRVLAAALEGDHRVRTIVDDVQNLDHIEAGSIDLLVMRAVLLYVPRKDLALGAARRVLATGGRLVISEPINRHLYYPAERFWGFDLSAIPAIASKLQQAFTEGEDPKVGAMLDWDDIALAVAVADSGFGIVRAETVTEILAGPVVPWLAFLHARWTPWLPSLAQAMSKRLTHNEAKIVESVMRPQLASGTQRLTLRNCFITATVE